MTLQRLHSEFPVYEENLIFFISVALILLFLYLYLSLLPPPIYFTFYENCQFFAVLLSSP